MKGSALLLSFGSERLHVTAVCEAGFSGALA